MSLIGKDVKKYILEEKYPTDKKIIYGVTTAVAVITAITIGYVAVKHPSVKPAQKQCAECHDSKKHNLTEYFKKKGSPEPEVMADAVLQTRNPRLLAAVAVKESTGNYRIRNAGYKNRHHGAFQVNPRDWGKVSTDPIDQALQAEGILRELVEEKGTITAALNQYGGDKTHKRYAKNILAELQEVPR